MSILVLAWFCLLGLTLGLFVALDGADLGIGVLFLAARDEKERSIMMAAIGPMWYANETWLVIAGAILFGAFPLAYGVLLSALYIPAMALLLGLALRAVSTELRVWGKKPFWGAVFGAGSCLAVLAQGFMLGGLLSGLKVSGGQYAGGAWDWLSPISLIVAAGIAAGYCMLGAAHMEDRTEGACHERYGKVLKVTAAASAAAFVAVITTAPILSPAVWEDWLEPPRPYVAVALFAGALLSFAMLLVRGRPRRAWSTSAFVFSAGAAVCAIFPYFIPPSVTVREAAAPPQTLLFMLAGVAVILPVIAVYNLYARGIFKGKVRGEDEDGY